MQAKILIWASLLVSGSSCVFVYVLHRGTWKSDLVAVIIILAACFQLYFYVLNERDKAKERKIKLKDLQRQSDYDERLRKLNIDDINGNFN